jgi:hypothetical protein
VVVLFFVAVFVFAGRNRCRRRRSRSMVLCGAVSSCRTPLCSVLCAAKAVWYVYRTSTVVYRSFVTAWDGKPRESGKRGGWMKL